MSPLRITLAILFVVCACLFGTSCTWSPKFAPLATVEINDSGNGSANGNTATLPVTP